MASELRDWGPLLAAVGRIKAIGYSAGWRVGWKGRNRMAAQKAAIELKLQQREDARSLPDSRLSAELLSELRNPRHCA